MSQDCYLCGRNFQDCECTETSKELHSLNERVGRIENNIDTILKLLNSKGDTF